MPPQRPAQFINMTLAPFPGTTSRFNRTFRTEVLDAHLFDDLETVRDLSWKWMISYNEERPHAALNNLTPSQYSNLKLSA